MAQVSALATDRLTLKPFDSADQVFTLALKSNAQIIGHIEIKLSQGQSQAELIYKIDSEYEHHGYGAEAASLMTTYAFEHLSVDQVIVVHQRSDLMAKIPNTKPKPAPARAKKSLGHILGEAAHAIEDWDKMDPETLKRAIEETKQKKTLDPETLNSLKNALDEF